MSCSHFFFLQAWYSVWTSVSHSMFCWKINYPNQSGVFSAFPHDEQRKKDGEINFMAHLLLCYENFSVTDGHFDRSIIVWWERMKNCTFICSCHPVLKKLGQVIRLLELQFSPGKIKRYHNNCLANLHSLSEDQIKQCKWKGGTNYKISYNYNMQVLLYLRFLWIILPNMKKMLSSLKT